MESPYDEDCFHSFFQVCVSETKLCNLVDDCGDGTDEEAAYCEGMHYIRDSFEDEARPYGVFSKER